MTVFHDADAIMVPNPLPFGYMVNCPVCESGPHLIRDKASADACNHAYPPCGHVLRIDPDKPCTCSRIEKGIFDKLPWNAKKIREKEEYDAETARLEAEHQQERDNAYRTHLDSLSPEDRQAAERAGQSHFEIIEQGRKARESMMANLNPSQIDNTDIINNSLDVFDRAWGVVKAPWIDGGSTHASSGKPVTIDGPLYSGGDILDEPRYWTDDVSEALAYAMFGSAIPRSEEEIIHGLKNFKNKVKMRETIPQIMVAPDPGDAWRGKDGHIDESLLDENDDIQNYILYDDQPYSEAWLADEHWGQPEHAPMPKDELEAMIQRIVDSGDDHYRGGNTGSYMSQEARRAHILGALERLQTNTRGQIHLPDDAKRFVHTSETDQITGDDDEEYLREWGRWEE